MDNQYILYLYQYIILFNAWIFLTKVIGKKYSFKLNLWEKQFLKMVIAIVVTKIDGWRVKGGLPHYFGENNLLVIILLEIAVCLLTLKALFVICEEYLWVLFSVFPEVIVYH